MGKKSSMVLLTLSCFMLTWVSTLQGLGGAAWANPATGTTASGAAQETTSGLTLKDVVRMESQLKAMKMQAAILTEKLHLMTINAQIADISKKTRGLSASMGAQHHMRVFSTGCFAGKCTATVARGNAHFTVNTGEQLNGYRFVRITSGGVMVSQNGMTRWLGIDGAISQSASATGSQNVALPSVGTLK